MHIKAQRPLPEVEASAASACVARVSMRLTPDPWPIAGAQPFTAGTVARTWVASERAAAFGLVGG